jgi:hypothetical protein
VNSLQQYIDVIVEPTLKDFERNPRSVRHAYLACVATYHAIDRATYPKRGALLREKWRGESLEFTIIDMVTHHLKHVLSDDENPNALARERGIRLQQWCSGAAK